MTEIFGTLNEMISKYVYFKTWLAYGSKTDGFDAQIRRH